MAADFGRSLEGYRRRLAIVALGGTVVDLVAVSLGGWLLAAIAVSVFPSGSAPLFLAAGGTAVGACVATVLLGSRFLRTIRSGLIPARLEREDPSFQGMLTTAQTVVARPAETTLLGYSPELTGEVLRRASGFLDGARPSLLYPRRRFVSGIGRVLSLGTVALAMLLADGSLAPRGMRALLLPVETWPSPTRGIRIIPEKAVVLAGGSLEVRALVDGAQTAWLDLDSRTEGESARKYSMERLSSGWFRGRLADLRATTQYRAVAGALSSPVGTVEIEPIPSIANLEAIVVSPAYARIPEKRLPGGHVQALRGSTITIAGRAVKPLRTAEMAFSWGTVLPMTIDGASVAATWTAEKQGWYRIRAKDLRGFSSPPGLEYPVVILEDRAPVVYITAPSGDLELVTPAAVTVETRIVDDYGISSAALRYRLPGGDERSLPLEVGGGENRKEFGGAGVVDLASLPLRPGNQVIIWVEARDNDVVSGPKVGTSRQLVVTIRDPSQQRRTLEEMEKRIQEEIITSLADGLEFGNRLDGAPPGERELAGKELAAFSEALRRRLAKASRDLTALAEAAGKSPQTPMTDLEEMDALAEQLQRLDRQASDALDATSQRLSPQAAKDSVEQMNASLEQAGLLADELPRRRNLREAANLGKDLMSWQNKLLDSLQKMEEGAATGALREVEDALKKIDDLLERLSEILSKASENLPEEFVNRDAIREFDLGSIQQALNEILSLARQGKAAEARAKAEELIKKLSKMLGELKDGRDEMEQRLPQEVAGELSRQQDVVQKMIERQQEILRKTQEIQNRVTADRSREADLRRKEQAQKIEESGRELKKALNDLKGNLQGKPLLQGSVGEVARTVEGRVDDIDAGLRGMRGMDVGEAMEELARGIGDFERLSSGSVTPENLEAERRESEAQLRKAAIAGRKMLDALQPLTFDPTSSLTPKERETLGELETRQRELEKDTSKLARKMSNLASLIPTMNRDAAEGFKSAADDMAAAGEALGRRNPLEATPPERSALQNLMKGKGGMDASMARLRRMSRMSGLRVGEGGAGRNPMGGFPFLGVISQPTVGKERGGNMGVSTQDFPLPGRTEFTPLPGLRESLQKSRGGSAPPAYRQQVEEYYDRLSGN